jgi:hypothetical protein
MSIQREIGYAIDDSRDNNSTVTVYPKELGLSVEQTIAEIRRNRECCVATRSGQDPIVNGGDSEDPADRWSLAVAPLNAVRPSRFANHVGCVDCGRLDERTGHQECEYPQDHD